MIQIVCKEIATKCFSNDGAGGAYRADGQRLLAHSYRL
jgi:hypothetical protein